MPAPMRMSVQQKDDLQLHSQHLSPGMLLSCRSIAFYHSRALKMKKKIFFGVIWYLNESQFPHFINPLKKSNLLLKTEEKLGGTRL